MTCYLSNSFACTTFRVALLDIYKTIGMMEKRGTVAAYFFFEYCDNRVHMRVIDIEHIQIMTKSTFIFRVLLIEICFR
jgi:hypothetical protein